MLDSHKLLLCANNQLLIINTQSNNNAFIINKGNALTNNASNTNAHMSLLSSFTSFLPAAVSALHKRKYFSYTAMQYYKPVASRTIIAALNNFGKCELYLLSGFNSNAHSNKNISYQIHDKCVIDLPNNGLLNGHKLFFYQYRHVSGICWFTLVVFYNSDSGGGGVAIQCQYKQESDTIVVLNEWQDLHHISNRLCIECRVINHLLYVCLMSTDGTDNDMSKYDIYFCDIKHFLSKRDIDAGKWKFQRILDSIQTQFNFDAFHEYLLQLRIEDLSNIEEYKQKLHELILHFWLVRLVDDPSLELNEYILNKPLNESVVREDIRELQPHWTIFKAIVVDFSVFIAGLIAWVGGLMLPYLMLYFAVLCAFSIILIVLFLKLY